ncbi:AbrB family transcriptional regulator [Pseudomonas sp. M30-35]|uniref:AbrB family transcriptional regulator n=1 Tax=Pseudomonas sp. M30-35 TaxID=1981174 RepID=UPI0012FE020F|nr:AbrB family transcriptional regulator [Pseudomonas sp. M30-35]
MTAKQYAELGGCYLLAIAAGYLAQQINLPLPWMIGPLVITALLNLAVVPVDVPVRTRPIGQMIVAAQVGLYFTADAALAIYSHGVAIVGVACLTIIFSFVISFLLRKLTGSDRVTALLSSIPGGPVEMGNLAIRYGGDPGPVVFAQTLRISAIVLLIPAALYYLLHTPVADRVLLSAAADPVGILVLSVGAALTSSLFYKLRINSPFFLGALAFSCIATSTSLLPVSPFPHAVVGFAQVLLGTWLGSTFRRELFRNAGRMIVAIFFTSSLLILLCAGVALGVASMSDMNWRVLVLGAAPGSVTEMALTAQYLHEDVALITAFHLVRIFMILPNIPWVLALVHRRALRESRRHTCGE